MENILSSILRLSSHQTNFGDTTNSSRTIVDSTFLYLDRNGQQKPDLSSSSYKINDSSSSNSSLMVIDNPLDQCDRQIRTLEAIEADINNFAYMEDNVVNKIYLMQLKNEYVQIAHSLINLKMEQCKQTAEQISILYNEQQKILQVMRASKMIREDGMVDSPQTWQTSNIYKVWIDTTTRIGNTNTILKSYQTEIADLLQKSQNYAQEVKIFSATSFSLDSVSISQNNDITSQNANLINVHAYPEAAEYLAINQEKDQTEKELNKLESYFGFIKDSHEPSQLTTTHETGSGLAIFREDLPTIGLLKTIEGIPLQTAIQDQIKYASLSSQEQRRRFRCDSPNNSLKQKLEVLKQATRDLGQLAYDLPFIMGKALEEKEAQFALLATKVPTHVDVSNGPFATIVPKLNKLARSAHAHIEQVTNNVSKRDYNILQTIDALKALQEFSQKLDEFQQSIRQLAGRQPNDTFRSPMELRPEIRIMVQGESTSLELDNIKLILSYINQLHLKERTGEMYFNAIKQNLVAITGEKTSQKRTHQEKCRALREAAGLMNRCRDNHLGQANISEDTKKILEKYALDLERIVNKWDHSAPQTTTLFPFTSPENMHIPTSSQHPFPIPESSTGMNTRDFFSVNVHQHNRNETILARNQEISADFLDQLNQGDIKQLGLLRKYTDTLAIHGSDERNKMYFAGLRGQLDGILTVLVPKVFANQKRWRVDVPNPPQGLSLAFKDLAQNLRANDALSLTTKIKETLKKCASQIEITMAGPQARSSGEQESSDSANRGQYTLSSFLRETAASAGKVHFTRNDLNDQHFGELSKMLLRLEPLSRKGGTNTQGYYRRLCQKFMDVINGSSRDRDGGISVLLDTLRENVKYMQNPMKNELGEYAQKIEGMSPHPVTKNDQSGYKLICPKSFIYPTNHSSQRSNKNESMIVDSSDSTSEDDLPSSKRSRRKSLSPQRENHPQDAHSGNGGSSQLFPNETREIASSSQHELSNLNSSLDGPIKAFLEQKVNEAIEHIKSTVEKRPNFPLRNILIDNLFKDCIDPASGFVSEPHFNSIASYLRTCKDSGEINEDYRKKIYGAAYLQTQLGKLSRQSSRPKKKES